MAAPIPVIVNTSAGPGHTDERLEQVRAAFAGAGVEVRMVAVRNAAELAEIARKEAAAKPAIVVAAGGDGTVNTVASAVAGSDTALGIVPLGTFNHFARDMQVPLELEEAARTIAANHQVSVDVAEVNGRVFINNSSIGLYPAIVQKRDSQQRRLGRSKRHAMFWATLTVMQRHPFLDLHLELDGVEQHRRSAFVFIGNNPYAMEGFAVGSRQCLNAGCLSVYLAHRRGRLALFALALRALFGRLKQATDFEALTTRTLRIETRHQRLPVATDGEVHVLDMPLEYRARPAALRVIVPLPQPQP
jgi:YegS/Rv2252/BmrU family lipid kinase